MNGLAAARLVAGRELREAFRRKAFWIGVLVLVVGSTAAMVVPEVLDHDSGTPRYEVVVVGDDPTLVQALQATEPGLGATLHITHLADRATATRRVDINAIDLAVVPGTDAGGAAQIIVRSGQHEALVAAARQAVATSALVQRLVDAGLRPEQVEDALALPAPQLREVDPGTDDRKGASFAVSLVLYILLLTLMVQVANGTAAEKANRVSEVLLPIVRPGPLLFGKVIGISIAGLCTLGAGMLPVVVKLAAGGDLPDGLAGALVGSGAWFALGLVLFLTLAGTLGALVERQEEAGSAITPVTALLIGTFIVTQGGADSTVGTLLAYVPFSAPLMVPARLAIGVTSPAELVGSLAILVGTIAVAARFGSTVYARAIVRTGRRLRLREVLRSA